MAWIESHQSLLHHRKTLAVASALHVDRYKLIGHLHALWWWGLDNADEDGVLRGAGPEAIAVGAGWQVKGANQFVGALLDAGFLELRDQVYVIHEWYEFAGKLFAQRDLRRLANRDAQRRHRERLSANVSDDGQQVSALTSDDGHDDRSSSKMTVSTLPYLTVPDLTNRSTSSSSVGPSPGSSHGRARENGLPPEVAARLAQRPIGT